MTGIVNANITTLNSNTSVRAGSISLAANIRALTYKGLSDHQIGHKLG